MAKKSDELAKPVESESLSEEGTDDGSTDGSDSEAEIPVNSGKKPAAVEPSSSDEEDEEEEGEDGSETDSASESDGPPAVVAAKPLPSSPKPAKSKPKKHEEEPATPTTSKAASLKRPPTDVKESAAAKKTKQKEPEVENSEKKQLFQRLWSEEDEIAILNGMIDYAAKKKADPVADLNAFHEFIKKSIHIDVTRSQLQDKIRRLKKKFENNKGKEMEGKNRTFSKTHELEAYELSKKIWDGAAKPAVANGGTSAKKKSSKAVVVAAAANAEEVKDDKIGEASDPKTENMHFGAGSVEERIMRVGSEAFEGGKGGEAGKEWKKLGIREIELYIAHNDVKRAQANLVLDLMKPSQTKG